MTAFDEIHNTLFAPVPDFGALASEARFAAQKARLAAHLANFDEVEAFARRAVQFDFCEMAGETDHYRMSVECNWPDECVGVPLDPRMPVVWDEGRCYLLSCYILRHFEGLARHWGC